MNVWEDSWDMCRGYELMICQWPAILAHTGETQIFSKKNSLQTYRSKFWNIFFPGFLLSVTCIIGTQGKPWKVFLILCKYIQANTGHGKLFRRWAVLFCYAAEIRISKYWIPYKNDHRRCTKEWILNKMIVNKTKTVGVSRVEETRIWQPNHPWTANSVEQTVD